MSFFIGNNSLAQATAGCEISFSRQAKGELCRQINRRYGYEFLRENKPEVTWPKLIEKDPADAGPCSIGYALSRRVRTHTQC
jgi:hypothetical protein